MKRILITGGLGNLGSWLTSHLIEKGYEVATFSLRDREVLKEQKFDRFTGNIEDEVHVRTLFTRQPWDVIIHLASINEGNTPGYAQKALQVNTWGTKNLLQALVESKHNTHFIYFSTFHIYGAGAGLIDEQTIPSPKNDYAATHLFAEYYVKQYAKHTIFRLSNSYGCPKEVTGTKWYLILNDLARMAAEEGRIKLNSNGLPKRDFIWMGDVCEVVEQTIEKGAANDVFNLANGQSIAMIDVARIVQQAYQDHFSKTIEVATNPADTNQYDDTLQVSVKKLQNWVSHQPRQKMYEEAIAVFNLLQTAKSVS